MSVPKIPLQSARESLEHLSRETRALAAADAAKRIDYIRRDRFIEHAGIKPAKARLLSLLVAQEP